MNRNTLNYRIFADAQSIRQAVYSGLGGYGIGSRVIRNAPLSKRNYAAECGDLWNHSIVAACLRWLCDNFPEPPLYLNRTTKSTGKSKRIDSHPILSLLAGDQDNDWADLSAGLVTSLCDDGNAYFKKIRRGRTGRVVKLQYLAHDECAPVWPSDGSEWISAYESRPEGMASTYVPKQDIVHFRKGKDPRNPRFGFSYLRAGIREIYTDAQILNHTAGLVRRGGLPSLFIAPKGADFLHDPQTSNAWQADIEASFGGENNGGVAFPPFPVDVTQVGISPDKLGIDILRNVPEARICALLGLHAMTVGLPVGADQRTYSNQGQCDRASQENGLMPLQKITVNRVGPSLCDDFGEDSSTLQLTMDWSVVAALRENADQLHNRVRSDWDSGVLTLGEARAETGRTEPEPGLRDKFKPEFSSAKKEPEQRNVAKKA